MRHSVYSFTDITMVISHPSVGSYTITGEGVGSMSVTMANDMTQHDIAADGSVMVSKIVTKAGSISMSLQQTSPAHLWMQKLLNYLMTAPTSEWALASAVITDPSVGETINISGISPQKFPDKPFQAAGQQATWNLLATTIEFTT